MHEPLMTTSQAAKVLGLSRRTLEAYRVRGGGPRFVRIAPTCVRYRPQDVEAWVDARLRENTSQEPQSAA